MTDIDETRLPGVGVRHDFETGAGQRLGVISHHGGDREVVIYDDHDPDAVRTTVRLSGAEATALAELLGGSRLIQRVEAVQQVEGLVIDWLTVAGDRFPTTIGDIGIRARTGVSIVAVLRDDEPAPAPGPDFELRAGDVAVVVGEPDGIHAAASLLSDQG